MEKPDRDVRLFFEVANNCCGKSAENLDAFAPEEDEAWKDL